MNFWQFKKKKLHTRDGQLWSSTHFPPDPLGVCTPTNQLESSDHVKFYCDTSNGSLVTELF